MGPNIWRKTRFSGVDLESNIVKIDNGRNYLECPTRKTLSSIENLVLSVKDLHNGCLSSTYIIE